MSHSTRSTAEGTGPRWLDGLASTHPSFWLLFGVLLALVPAILARPLAANHDVAYFLEVGRMILEGGRPYADYYEINPPLIHYLSVVPVWIGQILGVSPIPVYSMMVVGLLAWAAFSVRGLLRRSSGVSEWHATWVPAAMVLFSLEILTRLDFGQRDHLILLLLVPWIALRWSLFDGSRVPVATRVLVGAGCGVGVALKPHYLLVVALLELRLLVGRRDWLRREPAAESVAFVSVGATYLLHFLVLPPASREGFFGIVVP